MTEPTRNKVVWEVENTHPELIKPLDEALRQVIDPEIGLSVVELGLIRNISITDKDASISMIMTTPFCPYAPALLEMTRQKAEDTLERPTTISMGIEAWDPSMMEEGIGADWGLF
jgi:metal-sulfur cluster biosynthetic enzyme